MSIFKFIVWIFDIYRQREDMVDFLNSQGKLQPQTLIYQAGMSVVRNMLCCKLLSEKLQTAVKILRPSYDVSLTYLKTLFHQIYFHRM